MDWIYGKTVLVTGATSGIGRALTLQLIRNYNCKVIGIGRSNYKIETLLQQLSYREDQFSYRLFDVSVEENWITLAKELCENDIKIDLLINNAGMLLPFEKAYNYSEKQISQCMDVNFHASRYSIKALLPILQQSTTPGIVNISSAAALAPLVGTSIYSASKAAIKAYTEALIGDLGRKMYIGYVCPGTVKTDIFRNQYYKPISKKNKTFGMNADKMAEKILKRIAKQKARSVLGMDAKFMNFTSKFFPVLGLKMYENFIKISKMETFENIK